MTALLKSSLRQTELIYSRHHVKLDFYHANSVTYNPATSQPVKGELVAEIRGQIEDARAIRFLTGVTDSMIERFVRIISVPASDFFDDDVIFVPAVGDRLEWRAASVRDQGEGFSNYRVDNVFPRYIDGTVISYIVGLVNA